MVESMALPVSESPRAIQFHGDKYNVCAYFKETYNPANIFKNWYKIDASGSRNGPSLW